MTKYARSTQNLLFCHVYAKIVKFGLISTYLLFFGGGNCGKENIWGGGNGLCIPLALALALCISAANYAMQKRAYDNA